MKQLTIAELVVTLKEYPNQEAIVAIENNGYPYTTTIMLNEGFISPNMYMLKQPRIQKEYIMEDEIPPGKENDYQEVFILSALISKDELAESKFFN